jgi:hypothetical protein
MKTFDDLLLDYWFEDFEDFKNVLEKSDREGENSLFFWNAIWLLEDLYNEFHIDSRAELERLQKENKKLNETLEWIKTLLTFNQL